LGGRERERDRERDRDRDCERPDKEDERWRLDALPLPLRSGVFLLLHLPVWE